MQLKTRLFKLFAFTLFLAFILWAVTYRGEQITNSSPADEDMPMIAATDNTIAGEDTSLPYDSATKLTTIMSSSKSITIIDPNDENRARRLKKILERKRFGLQRKDSLVDNRPRAFLQVDSTRLSKQHPAKDSSHHQKDTSLLLKPNKATVADTTLHH